MISFHAAGGSRLACPSSNLRADHTIGLEKPASLIIKHNLMLIYRRTQEKKKPRHAFIDEVWSSVKPLFFNFWVNGRSFGINPGRALQIKLPWKAETRQRDLGKRRSEIDLYAHIRWKIMLQVAKKHTIIWVCVWKELRGKFNISYLSGLWKEDYLIDKQLRIIII